MDNRNDIRPVVRRDNGTPESTYVLFGHAALLGRDLLSSIQSYATHHVPSRDRLKRLGLSERDVAILNAIADCRLMTTTHVQRLFFTDYDTDQLKLRATRRACNRLEKHGYINKVRRIGGADAGSTVSDYSLNVSGARLVSSRDRHVEPYFPDPQDYFYEHTMGLTGLYTDLRELSNAGKLQLVELATEPLCWRVYANATKELRPDMSAITMHQVNDDAELFYWFIEWDRSTEHQPQIVQRLRQYQEYCNTGIEQQTHGVFPLVLWVVPDARRKNELQKIIRETPGIIPDLFVIKTASGAIGYFCDPM